jgi:hypothetical protein
LKKFADISNDVVHMKVSPAEIAESLRIKRSQLFSDIPKQISKKTILRVSSFEDDKSDDDWENSDNYLHLSKLSPSKSWKKSKKKNKSEIPTVKVVEVSPSKPAKKYNIKEIAFEMSPSLIAEPSKLKSPITNHKETLQSFPLSAESSPFKPSTKKIVFKDAVVSSAVKEVLPQSTLSVENTAIRALPPISSLPPAFIETNLPKASNMFYIPINNGFTENSIKARVESPKNLLSSSSDEYEDIYESSSEEKSSFSNKTKWKIR